MAVDIGTPRRGRAATQFVLLSTVTSLLLPTPRGRANVVGSDTQHFNPVSGTTSFVTAHSTGVLAPGHFNIGLFLNEATNTLPYATSTKQSRSHINDTLLNSDINAGVGLFPRVEMGVAVPFLLNQTVKEDDTRGEFASSGNTEVRAGFKVKVIDAESFGLATVLSSNINRTKDNPYTGSSTAPIYNLEVAVDNNNNSKTGGPFTLALNLGYRWREPSEKIAGALVDPISNQAIASVAAAMKTGTRGSVVAELFGSKALTKGANETNRSLNSGEFLLGYRHDFTPMLTGHIGAGTEVMHGLSTPDWRVYLGLVTTFGDRDNTVNTSKPRRKTPPVVATSEKPLSKPIQEPAMALIPTAEPDERVILRDINFEFDSDYRVMPGAFTELDRVAKRLQVEGFKTVVVEGHTDFMGTDEYNDDLSFRRASTVRRYMIRNFGLDEKAVIAVGYGERFPIATNETDEGRLKNRRVEIKIFNN